MGCKAIAALATPRLHGVQGYCWLTLHPDCMGYIYKAIVALAIHPDCMEYKAIAALALHPDCTGYKAIAANAIQSISLESLAKFSCPVTANNRC